MDLQTAKLTLTACVRGELRDHAFGDVEITWGPVDERGEFTAIVAEGYFGSGSGQGITVYDPPTPLVDGYAEEPPGQKTYSFDGKEAQELRKCGALRVERNDSTGPDRYSEGSCMPGLTLEGVRKELCG